MGHTGFTYWPIRYELSQTAYIKIVLHALKHPSSAINGILIGTYSNYTTVEIVDAMPVSHSPSTFFTPFQIANFQLDHKKLDHLIKENDGDPAVMIFTCGISRTPCLQAGPEARDELVLKEPSAHALLA
ncbi:ER membrane protein complex subunit 8/9 homolog [Carex rostrata]